MDDRPGTLEVIGPDLAAKLADLKARGATAHGMAAVGTGRWRLSIHWPASAVQLSFTDERSCVRKNPCDD